MKLPLKILLVLLGCTTLIQAQNTNDVFLSPVKILANTNMTVFGNITVDSSGVIEDNGVLDIKGNFTNNTLNNGFGALDSGLVILSGDTQQVAGQSSTYFPNLIASGTGNKSLQINTVIRDSLALNDRVINAGAYTLKLLSADTAGISRTSGYVNTGKNGMLERATNSTGNYLYPLGDLGQNAYRPLIISPSDNSANSYQAGLRFVNASVDGFNTQSLDTGLCAVNNKFYHLLNQTAGSAAAAVTLFYQPAQDGNFNSFGFWNASKWARESPAVAVNSPLTGIGATSFDMFNSQPVILGEAGGAGIPPMLTANDTFICSSDSARICAPEGFASYHWNNGDTSACIYTNVAGANYVTVSNANGCSSLTSVAVNVHVYPASSISLEENGDTLSTSTTGSAYQWYDNSALLSGATSPVYIAPQTGNYSVQVTDTNGCAVTSSAVNVMVAGIKAVADNNNVTLYPNPSDGYFFVSYQGPWGTNFFMSVFNLLGEEVGGEYLDFDGAISLPVSLPKLPNGEYFLRFQSDTETFTRAITIGKN